MRIVFFLITNREKRCDKGRDKRNTYQRPNTQPNWIVKWADNQHSSLRLLTDNRTHSGEVKTERGFDRLGPLFNTIDLLRDFTNGRDDFEPVCERGSLVGNINKNDEGGLTCGTPTLAFQGLHSTTPRNASCYL